MNANIEKAMIANLVKKFPSSKIYTGKLVQGVKPTDIIVNTVEDEIVVLQGSPLRERTTIASVSYVNPTEDITDDLVDCLQIFETEIDTVYSTSINIQDEDGLTQALVTFTHLER